MTVPNSVEMYHYSNNGELRVCMVILRSSNLRDSDGSYYSKNGDSSTYNNDRQGSATHTAPNGNVYKK